MSRRHRILAWAKTDAQRMKDEAVLAKVTARITYAPAPLGENEMINLLFYGTAVRPSFSQRMGLKPVSVA